MILGFYHGLLRNYANPIISRIETIEEAEQVENIINKCY